MKERIKELMHQAGTDTSGKWMGVNHAEKLVELVVTECFKAAIIESNGHMNPIDLMKRMKEQVGVE